MVRGYSVLASSFQVTPTYITEVTDSFGTPVRGHPAAACRDCGVLAAAGLDSADAHHQYTADWKAQCPIDPVVPNNMAPQTISAQSASSSPTPDHRHLGWQWLAWYRLAGSP